MKTYLPIMLDVTEKNILILGGGKASAEKLKTLSSLNKKIRVISKSFIDEFLDKPYLELIQKEYEYGDLAGFDVVYSGVNDKKVESEILREARERKILINFIDQVEYSDFISAASIIKDSFSIFISTYGRSPAGAKKLRQEIESKLDLELLNQEISRLAEERKKRKENVSSL